MSRFSDRIKKIPFVSAFIELTKRITVPGFQKLPLHDVGLFFFKGLKHGALVTRATSVAYYFFMTLFPSVIFLFTLIPYVPIKNFQVVLFEQLQKVMPGYAFKTAEDTIVEIITKPHSGLLSVGFLLTLWFSTNGFSALISAFNQTYHSMETRSWWQTRMISIALVIITTLIIILGVGLIVLTEKYPGHGFWYYAIATGRWILLFALLFIFFSLIYYLGPARKNKWKFFSAGSSFATVLSVVASFGFTWYVNNFSSYNKLYGSIGALIVIMLFIYFNSLILLLGFELNASIHSAKNHKGNEVDFSVLEEDQKELKV
ncbi:MAG TPA: YihY/virulence factor BrkB family protein [Bacteroidia bacterium]|jgi:membrane protein